MFDRHEIYLFIKQRLWEFSSPWRYLPDISMAIGKPDIEKQIAYSQFQKLMHGALLLWCLSAVGFLLWGAVIWPFVDNKWPLLFWLIAVVCCFGYGSFINHPGKLKSNDSIDLRKVEIFEGKINICLGTLIGLSGFTLPQNSTTLDPLFVVFLLLMNSGNLNRHTVYRYGMLWMTLPSMTLGIMFLLLRADLLSVGLAAGVLLAMFAMYRLSNTAAEMIEIALIAAEEKKLLLDEVQLRRREAEVANLAKTRFLTAASHDLRQPINSISLLLGALHGASQPFSTQLIHRIEKSIQNMDHLLSSITEASTLELKNITLVIEQMPLLPLLQRLQEQFQPQVLAKKLSLQVISTPDWIMTDGFQLYRILSNLMTNAIRYTENGGIIIRAKIRGNRVVIQIWDTGIGIRKAFQSQIFEEFYQLNSNEKPQQITGAGMGLGLYIVKRIAEHLQHPISVKSRLGKGSVFTVSVPLASSGNAAALIELTTEHQQDNLLTKLSQKLTGSLVLVIEDNADVLQDLSIFLNTLGCHVLSSNSLDSARTVVEKTLRTPDLIISDYRLNNGFTGVDAITQIRIDVDEAIPAVLITAEYSVNLEEKNNFHGIPVLTKPLNLSNFFRVIDGIFHKEK
jgi:signal transduction histidine kinase